MGPVEGCIVSEIGPFRYVAEANGEDRARGKRRLRARSRTELKIDRFAEVLCSSRNPAAGATDVLAVTC